MCALLYKSKVKTEGVTPIINIVLSKVIIFFISSGLLTRFVYSCFSQPTLWDSYLNTSIVAIVYMVLVGFSTSFHLRSLLSFSGQPYPTLCSLLGQRSPLLSVSGCWLAFFSYLTGIFPVYANSVLAYANSVLAYANSVLAYANSVLAM